MGNWYFPSLLNLFFCYFFTHNLLASREWVIPAKPKPGRKPKKDLASTSDQTSDVIILFLVHYQDCSALWVQVPDADANGRRVQNRYLDLSVLMKHDLLILYNRKGRPTCLQRAQAISAC